MQEPQFTLLQLSHWPHLFFILDWIGIFLTGEPSPFSSRSLAAEVSLLTIPSNLAEEGFLIFFLGKSMELLCFLAGIFVVVLKAVISTVSSDSYQQQDRVNE